MIWEMVHDYDIKYKIDIKLYIHYDINYIKI